MISLWDFNASICSKNNCLFKISFKFSALQHFSPSVGEHTYYTMDETYFRLFLHVLHTEFLRTILIDQYTRIVCLETNQLTQGSILMHCNSFKRDFINCIISFRKVISTQKVVKRLDVNYSPLPPTPMIYQYRLKKKSVLVLEFRL